MTFYTIIGAIWAFVLDCTVTMVSQHTYMVFQINWRYKLVHSIWHHYLHASVVQWMQPCGFNLKQDGCNFKKKSLLSFQSFGHFGVLLTPQNWAKFRTVMSRWFDVPPFAAGASSAPENSCGILKRSLLFRCGSLVRLPPCLFSFLSCDIKTSHRLHLESLLGEEKQKQLSWGPFERKNNNFYNQKKWTVCSNVHVTNSEPCLVNQVSQGRWLEAKKHPPPPLVRATVYLFWFTFLCKMQTAPKQFVLQLWAGRKNTELTHLSRK